MFLILGGMFIVLYVLVLYEVTFRALHEKREPSASALKKSKD